MDTRDDPESPRHPSRIAHQFRRAMRLRCPVCGTGRLFRGIEMHAACPSCGFAFEREPGYWTNAVTLNFMMSGGLVLLIVGPLVFTGMPLWASLSLGLVLAAAVPLACFRHFKAIWLAIDLSINPPTAAERIAGFLRVTRRAAEPDEHAPDHE